MSAMHLLASLPPARLFYALQAASLLSLWLAVKAGSGVDFFRLGERLSNTALRPSCLPQRLFLLLLRPAVFRPAAYGLVPSLAAASFWDAWGLRLLVAVFVTIFQLGDSCRTSSHRDYLMLYNAWSLALLPVLLPAQADDVAQALALGFCVAYVLGSGWAKLVVGGPGAWAGGALSAILGTFSTKAPKQSGPILRPVSRWLARERPAARRTTRVLGLLTLLLECVLAPVLGLLGPRMWLVAALLLLHLGIGALQSGAIGAFFLPCLASYVLGLQAGPAVGSPLWWGAAALALSPLLCCVRRTRLLQEDWPLTPFALFPWSGEQWRLLHGLMVEGDCKLVMFRGGGELLGARVAALEHRADEVAGPQQHGQLSEGELVAYDCWNRVLGVTTFQDSVLCAVLKVSSAGLLQGEDEARQALAAVVAEWLQGGRMLEVSSGRALDQAAFVRVGPDGRVAARITR